MWPRRCWRNPEPERRHSPTESRIAIIGAGAAGLTAAWELARLGYRHITILEKDEDVGGKLQRHAFAVSAGPAPVVALRGITRIMEHLGLWSGPSDRARGPVHLSQSRWVRAPMAGIFHATAENGSHVARGMVLGFITDPYGEQVRHVKSPIEGYLLCVNTSPVVNQGDALMHIAYDAP